MIRLVVVNPVVAVIKPAPSSTVIVFAVTEPAVASISTVPDLTLTLSAPVITAPITVVPFAEFTIFKS